VFYCTDPLNLQLVLVGKISSLEESSRQEPWKCSRLASHLTGSIRQQELLSESGPTNSIKGPDMPIEIQ
jgi:hypothetical protein